MMENFVMAERTLVSTLAAVYCLLLLCTTVSGTYYNQPHVCNDPGAPLNGSRLDSGWFGAGYSVRYICNTGFRLVGSATSQCVFGKFTVHWSSEVPLCVPDHYPPSMCNDPPPAGRDAILSVYNTTLLKYRCRNNDYVHSSGEELLVCSEMGHWIGRPLSCRKKAKCPNARALEHGTRQVTGLLEGDTVTFFCRMNYKLIGVRVVVCNSRGHWSARWPRCKAVCGDPGTPQNSERIRFDGEEEGDIAEYKCLRGFRQSGGTKRRMCRSTAQWYGTALVCERNNCGSPPTIKNGAISFNSTLYESKAVYTCNKGHNLVGMEIIKCLSHGQWSSVSTRCDPIRCPRPPKIDDGDVRYVRITFGAKAIYNCRSSEHVLIGNATLACATSGQWAPSPPTCVVVVNCGVLPNPTNGLVTLGETRVGSIAVYSCIDGYTLQGVSERTCLMNGSWSEQAPQCTVTESNCQNLVNPDNGNVEFNSTSIDSIAIYSCVIGYRLSTTSNERRCLSTRVWSGDAPFCIRVTCSQLFSPPNGDVLIINGTTALYTCVMGYQLVGINRTCLPSGNWSGSNPTCIAVDCGYLPAPINGLVVQNNTVFNSTAVYSCNIGYILNGDQTRLCQENGMWSSVAPTCSSSSGVPIGCGDLEDPLNGNVSYINTTTGSVATYTCREGFLLNGTNTRMCVEAGNWSGAPPKCQVVDCGSPPSVLNGIPQYNVTIFRSVVVYSCIMGHNLASGNTRECLSTGNWSLENIVCNIVDCGLLGPVENSVLSYTPTGITRYGAQARYQCIQGHILVGNGIRTCLESGIWNGAEPSCTPVDCGPLADPANGTVAMNSTTLNSSSHYMCNTGFVLVGNRQRRCSFEGEWNGTVPVCVATQCEILPSPRGGSVSLTGRLINSTATYQCHTGFSLKGNALRTCREAGWSGETPECIDNDSVDCGSLSFPTNGILRFSSTTIGGVARYSCSDLYRLLGSSTRTCMINGQWSGTEPTCVLIDCGNPGRPINGVVRFRSTTFGSQATYSCFEGYTLIGINFRICGSQDVWSNRVPICQINDCGNPGNLPNGRVSAIRTTFAGQATFECNDGFRLVGNSERTCLANGQWTGNVPTCLDERSDCGDPGTPLNGQSRLPGTRQGDTVRYTCDNRYTIHGDTERRCQANGLWSGSLPICQISCTNPGLLVNGRRINSNFGVGDVVYFVCMDDYDLIGSNARRCQDNGTWSGTQPICTLRNDSCSVTGSKVTDNIGRECQCIDGQLRNCCRLREDWTTLTNDRKAQYIKAVKSVSSDSIYRSRYRDLMSLFLSSDGTLAQSQSAQTSQKLPWLRYFLQQYEDLLRMVDSSITIPFWDWTISNTDPYRHPVFDSLTGFGNTSRSTDDCVNSGPFRVGEFSLTPSSGGGCLTRQYTPNVFLLRSSLERIVLRFTASRFVSFFNRIAFFPYVNVHCSVNGVLCSNTSAEDPLYLLSGAFVDKVWDLWQSQSEDRLRAQYADDQSPLALTSLTVSQYSNNAVLPFGASVCYGSLTSIRGRGAQGAGGTAGESDKGIFLTSLLPSCQSEQNLISLGLSREEIKNYYRICSSRHVQYA